MAVVFEKTKALTDVKLHYCPGCAHGIVHRLVAEVLEELGEVETQSLAYPQVVLYLQTTTSTLTLFSVHMVVLPQQQQVSREYILTKSL